MSRIVIYIIITRGIYNGKYHNRFKVYKHFFSDKKITAKIHKFLKIFDVEYIIKLCLDLGLS